jgi:hypothetical protein
MSNHGHKSQFLTLKIQRVDGGRIYISGVESKRRLILESGPKFNRWFLVGGDVFLRDAFRG